MEWGGPGFVIAIIAISTFGWLASTWIRARHGYPIENEWCGTARKEDPAQTRQVELLSAENNQLKSQVSQLEERLRVLERIATDPAARIEREIEELRQGR
jgi:uncharacterized protein YlxW (UPF0749 family)